MIQPRPPKSVHKKFQPNRSSRLAGYWWHIYECPVYAPVQPYPVYAPVQPYPVYAHVKDLELWSAGISEIPLQDRLIGPTLSCVIGRQFHNIRFGDRLVTFKFYTSNKKRHYETCQRKCNGNLGHLRPN